MINKNKNNFIIIETTTPSIDLANKIAKILLAKKIAGCIEMNQITSIYNWQEEICQGQEISLRIKTQEKFFDEIVDVIKKNHQYSVAQIFSYKIDNIEKSYGDWLQMVLKK